MCDYIKREDAIKALSASELIRNRDSVKTDLAHIFHRSAERCIAKVAPADVRENIHARWIVKKRNEHYPSGKGYEAIYCSACGRRDHNGDGMFCGYCGAIMDEEVNK